MSIDRLSLLHLQPPDTARSSSSSSSSSTRRPLHLCRPKLALNVAVVGCAHGELSAIYAAVAHLSSLHSLPVHLLLCCGDFEACRDEADLSCMACPPKYRHLPSFARFHSGELPPPPLLTVYVGGNHEASNLHCSLPHGGFVCHNVFYLGLAAVVRVGGWRIAGLSGIGKGGREAEMGHWERLPFDNSSMRSVYHIRRFDAWRLMQTVRLRPQGGEQRPETADMQSCGKRKRKEEEAEAGDGLSSPSTRDAEMDADGGSDDDGVSVVLTHDWPRGIARYGDLNALLRRKPYLRSEIGNNTLGSDAAEQLLQTLRPRYFFSAHHHVKFPAVVPHPDNDGIVGENETLFLALDKALPNRDYLQLVALTPSSSSSSFSSPPPLPSAAPLSAVRLQWDVDWLCVVRATHHLVNLTRERRPTPSASFSPTDDDRREMMDRLRVWYRQQRAEERNAEDEQKAGQQEEEEEERLLDVPAYRVEYEGDRAAAAGWQSGQPVRFVRNGQTTLFCRLLGIPDLHSDAQEGKGSDRWQATAAYYRPQQQQQQQLPASSPPQAPHRNRWDQPPPPAPAAAALRGSNPDEIDIDSDSEHEQPAAAAAPQAES